MEEKLTSGSSAQQQKPKALGELVRQAGIYFQAIGMQHDEFWHGDTRRLREYEEVNEYREMLKNRDLHLQGYYFYTALQSALAQAFFDGKGKRPEPYPAYPMALTAMEKQWEKERKIQHTLAWVRKGQENG